MSLRCLLAAVLLCCISLPLIAQDRADWNKPQQPFNIYGNTFYVGPHGLSSVLITTSKGLVLIDGDLPESAPLIEANIRALGFRMNNIHWILNSHAHGDHAGGIAALQRVSGAQVLASADGVRVLAAGGNDPNDPQFGELIGYTPVKNLRAVRDGEILHFGNVAVTAHATPGHTAGSMSWTWESCEVTGCKHMVYADSLTAISAPGFRFTDDKAHPHRVEDFYRAIATVAALPCDILLTPHPDASGFWEKMRRPTTGQQPGPVFDPTACRTYAAQAKATFDKRMAQERAASHGAPH